MTIQTKKQSPYRREIYQRAIAESFRKLDPRTMVRNPVMFVVEVGSLLTTVLWIQALVGTGEAPTGFIGAIALWLWFTVLFANFSEAIAEGRGKAQAESLRKARQDTPAKKIKSKVEKFEGPQVEHQLVSSTALRKGDYYLVETGDILPADGEIVAGNASLGANGADCGSTPGVVAAGRGCAAADARNRLRHPRVVGLVAGLPEPGVSDV